MRIEEVDFNNLGLYNKGNYFPVFVKYGDTCYEIASSSKYKDKAWPCLLKLFLYNFALDYTELVSNYIDKNIDFTKLCYPNTLFSFNDKRFNTQKGNSNRKTIKVGRNLYSIVFKNHLLNLSFIKFLINKAGLGQFKLYIASDDSFLDSKFNDGYRNLVSKYKKRYIVKKGNPVLGHINSTILNEKEKLINYINNELSNRTLIGDITLDDKQTTLLEEYMKDQVYCLCNNPDYIPDYPKAFMLGMVRYAQRNYNKNHRGDFWAYFPEEYGCKAAPSIQSRINLLFSCYSKDFGFAYDDSIQNKIDNITMHSFVATNSANQLFDYIFDFYRTDLRRNIANLDIIEDDSTSFSSFIDALEHGAQNVMAHTSLLLRFPKTKPVFKNRIRRILRLIDDSFWNNNEIKQTGNRINYLLSQWEQLPKGSFQKDKNRLAKKGSGEKGETLFRSPILSIANYNDETKAVIILPFQRLKDCSDDDNPLWSISCSNHNINIEDLSPDYQKDKIGYFCDKTKLEIPFSSILDGFKVTLSSNGKIIKKYEIKESPVRLFDEKGKNIDLNSSSLNPQFVTSVSSNKDFPYIYGLAKPGYPYEGLFIKTFSSLSKGQIMILNENSGIEIGESVSEGLIEKYPYLGSCLAKDGITYGIYPSLPKLLFNSDSREIEGISLIINKIQNKVASKRLDRISLAKMDSSSYILDLNDYINKEGLYDVYLSFPRYNKTREIGHIAYIKGFEYRFMDAPYIFKDEGSISFPSFLKIDTSVNSNKNEWASLNNINRYSFIFDELSENECSTLVEDGMLHLKIMVDGNYEDMSIQIPSIYYRFDEHAFWNSKHPNFIPIKGFKDKFDKLYIKGPFDFASSYLYFPYDDLDIAYEESRIRFDNGYFDTSKIYSLLRNNRDKQSIDVNIYLGGNSYKFFSVITRSKLNNVTLIGDFASKCIKGEVDIEGDGLYSITIKHKGNFICEDEPIKDNKFKIDIYPEEGEYEIYVYELIEGEEDGFDMDEEAILLNEKPIVARIINLVDLTNRKINLKGYKYRGKDYLISLFKGEPCLTNFERISYDDLLNEDRSIVGIWDKDIDSGDEEMMRSYSYSKAILSFIKENKIIKEDVVVFFKDKNDIRSLVIMPINEDGDFDSLIFNRETGEIIPNIDEKSLSSSLRRKCGLFYDDICYYEIEFQED